MKYFLSLLSSILFGVAIVIALGDNPNYFSWFLFAAWFNIYPLLLWDLP